MILLLLLIDLLLLGTNGDFSEGFEGLVCERLLIGEWRKVGGDVLDKRVDGMRSQLDRTTRPSNGSESSNGKLIRTATTGNKLTSVGDMLDQRCIRPDRAADGSGDIDVIGQELGAQGKGELTVICFRSGVDGGERRRNLRGVRTNVEDESTRGKS